MFDKSKVNELTYSSQVSTQSFRVSSHVMQEKPFSRFSYQIVSSSSTTSNSSSRKGETAAATEKKLTHIVLLQ